jgi:hypothetical protein
MKLLRSILALFFIFAVFYCGWKIAPCYIANFELEDAMEEAARLGVVNYRSTDADLRASVMREVRSEGIPLTEDDILIERPTGDIFISAEYTVHVDMPLYPFDLHFHPMSKNKKRLMN